MKTLVVWFSLLTLILVLFALDQAKTYVKKNYCTDCKELSCPLS